MQVFGLPGHLIRNGGAASRLIDAKDPARNGASTRRRRALASAMAKGLSAEDAAAVVGVPRSTLYRWEKPPEPKSRRPHRLRKPPGRRRWYRRWRSCGPTTRCGASASSSGSCAARASPSPSPPSAASSSIWSMRGVVTPVPTLRRKPGGRRFRLLGQQRHARRLPKGLKPTRPGEIVQLDTALPQPRARPGRSSTSPPTIRSPNGPSPPSQPAPPPISPPPSSTSSSPTRPSRSQASRSTAAPSSWPTSSGLPEEAPRPLRAAAQATAAQRRSGALQRLLAIRVLRRLRPAPPPRSVAAPRRRLRPPLQPPQAARRPRRQNPSRVSQDPQLGHSPAVSYVLNPDTRLLFVQGHSISPRLERAHRLAVRTPPSHGGNRGSIPLGRTNKINDLASFTDFRPNQNSNSRF